MRKHSQQFKLVFFTINLHFITSDQVSKYRKLTLPLTSIIYLFDSPLEMRKKDSNKLKLIDTLLFLKRNDPQSFKGRCCENAFLQREYYWWDLLELFLFHVITGWCYFSSWLLLWDWFYCHIVAFLEASFLKEIRILCVISTIIILC